MHRDEACGSQGEINQRLKEGASLMSTHGTQYSDWYSATGQYLGTGYGNRAGGQWQFGGYTAYRA